MASKSVGLSPVPQPPHPGRLEGFTPLKVVLVIAILGILIGSSLPAYKVYQQRAYAAEASFRLSQILRSETDHFRKHDRFYPKDGHTLSFFHGNPTSEGDLQALENALGTDVLRDDQFDYYIQACPGTADGFCMVMVSAPFPLFADGPSQLLGLLDRDGRLSVLSAVLLTGDRTQTKSQKTGILESKCTDEKDRVRGDSLLPDFRSPALGVDFL